MSEMRHFVYQICWASVGALFVACSSLPPQDASLSKNAPATSSPESSNKLNSAANPTGTESAENGVPPRPGTGESVAHAVTASPLTLSFLPLLETPLSSFALGNGQRISALGNEPWIFEGHKWREVPVPAHLRNWDARNTSVRIFYGRDNQPRLMGWTDVSGSTEPGGVYLRHKATGWQREPAELGRLGHSRGALYGILGEADPEVVCRPGDICLIKRVSGWGQTPADAEPAWVQMAGTHVFKVTDSQVSQLVKDSWETVIAELPSGEVTNVWGDGEGALFLIAGGQLFRKDDEKWSQLATPLDSCRAIAAQPNGKIWVGGTNGVCRLEGAEVDARPVWSCAQQKLGAVVQIEVTSDAVFMASDQGLFRALL